MNIKELAIKYEFVAFLCNSQNEFIEFVNQATDQIFFSKTWFIDTHIETKESILKNYTHTGKSFAIIEIKKLDNKKEFRFYSRDYNKYYIDYERVLPNYKIINFAKYQRKEKLMKINEKFSYR